MKEINEANNGLRSSRVQITFGQFVEREWKDFLRNKKKLKESTSYNYDAVLRKHILPKLGKKGLDVITRSDVAEMLGGMTASGYSAKYRLNVYSLLCMIFEVAVEYEMIEVSPMRRKHHRPEFRPTEKPTLSAAEVKAVLDNLDRDYWTLCVLISTMILRIGELLALRWCDLDFEAGTLTVNHSLWKGRLYAPKTRGSQKSYRLPPAVLDLLRRHRESSSFTRDEDFVFCRAAGEPLRPNYLRDNVLYPAMDAAGIKRSRRTHGFHMLRHSGASILYKGTRDLKLVQTQLRHSRIGTTSDIYVHIGESIPEEATGLLAEKLIPEFCGFPVVEGATWFNKDS